MSIWTDLLRQPDFIDRCTRHLPLPLKRAVLAQHERTRQVHAGPIYDGTRDANIELREFSNSLHGPLPWFTSGDNLRTWAKARARQTGQAMSHNGHSTGAAYEIGARIVRRFSLKPPVPSPEHPVKACVQRMRCDRWWRRQARQKIERRTEAAARALGLVQARTGRYVSDYTAAQWRSRQQCNQAILAECEAVNERGDTYSLAELVALSVANPALRRNELMARLAGTEAYARAEGDVAVFFTWTAPGFRHAVHSKTVRVDRAGAKYSPRDTHAYLCRLWSQARAELDRQGVRYYGIRVAEPHHDGTPHWHLLVFLKAGKPLKQLERVLRRYALKDAPDEPGARKHRFKVEYIDPAKGTATGYVAKYIAKNIDGAGLDATAALGGEGEWLQDEQSPATAAERARAWASTWGIRQFQFFGVPEVGLWRELRRLDAIEGHDDAEALRQAADTGDWHDYMRCMGGPCMKRSQRPAGIERVEIPRQRLDGERLAEGRYGEPLRKPLMRVGEVVYDARPHRWQINYKPTQQWINPVYVTNSESVYDVPSRNEHDTGHGAGAHAGAPFKASRCLKENAPHEPRLKAEGQCFKAETSNDESVTLPPIDAPFIHGSPTIPGAIVGSLSREWRELEALIIEACGSDWRRQRPPASHSRSKSPSLEFCQ